jgi:molecular chaperone DnaK (HSP70)
MHIVGIDLGTTNSALASVSLERPEAARIRVEPITQLVGPGDAKERPTLPSFLYLAGAHELPAGAATLPWEAEPITAIKGPLGSSGTGSGPSSSSGSAAGDGVLIVGEYARTQGMQVPARLVSSAKSWLCHPKVDRLAPILPWGESVAPGSDEAFQKISPVDASTRYLQHLAGLWRHRTGRALTDEEVVLCVPASFDEVARELTLRAAAQLGLRPTLLEEPQAAFYSWLADHETSWTELLKPGDTVLVFDVGGGTTDFSLIAVREGEGGRPTIERTAVGDHLLLGGDNMDLAIARRVESRVTSGGKLDPHAFLSLVQACRIAKERLLSDPDRQSWTVTVPGRGSRLIGGALRDELSRAEVEELVLDGFFPRVAAEARAERARAGVREFGLPYAADPAITRHAAQFLSTHNARPSAILWNGGVLKSPAIRDRVLEVLGGWLGAPPRVLPNAEPDLAVARGAAYYGLARRGLAMRIGGGAARAYYLGVDRAEITPGKQTVLCLTPRGFREGEEITVDQQPLELLTNRPVRFRLFSSSERQGDKPGALLTVAEGELAEQEPIYTVLRFTRSSQDVALSVNLHARLTELGTLELEAVARATGNDADRWRLNFDLRAAEEPSAAPTTPAPSEPAVDQAALDKAVVILKALYGKEDAPDPVGPAGVMKQLGYLLGPKESWSPTVLRALWEPLKDLRGGRGKSPAHEARWLNLVGYCLRPGFGYPLDDWRVKETWRLFNAGVVHEKDEPCRLEWWILWRRVSGGLTRTQQDEIYKRLAPHFVPSFAKKADRKPPSTQEAAEMWRTLASMERLPPKAKVELGEILVSQLEKTKKGGSADVAAAQALWALGRFGARVPLYGPAEDVIPPKKAERWIERLLALADAQGPARPNDLALALAELARCSGDRARDLDDALRKKLAARLSSLSPEGARLSRLVLEPVPREAREERLAFGDALPSGLRLVADGT